VRRSMSQEKDERIVTLVSADGQRFELTAEAAKNAQLVRRSLNLGGDEDEDDDEPPDPLQSLDLLRVSGRALDKVVDFLKHYDQEKMMEIPQPLGANTFNEVSYRFVVDLSIRSVLNT